MSTNLAKKCDIIEENFILYDKILFTPKILYNPIVYSNEKQIKSLRFEITSNICPDFPHSDMDESCKYILKFFLFIHIKIK